MDRRIVYTRECAFRFRVSLVTNHKHSLSNSLRQAAVSSIAAICPVLATDPGVSANTSLSVLWPQPAQTGMQNFAQFLARERIKQRM